MKKHYSYVSFLETINSLESDVLYSAILEHAVKLPRTYDEGKVKKYLEDAYDHGSLSMTIDRLDKSLVIIDSQIDLFSDKQDIAQCLVTLKNNIVQIITIIKDVVEGKHHPEENDELTGKASSLKSFEEKAEELQKRLERLENKIATYESSLNDKLFSLIINTVAILGIFVAVAFAGFGANALFDNIVFDISQHIVTNVFYLSLTALFSYNLLFLLFYCIFRIIERLSSDTKTGLVDKCKSFFIIDAIGFVLTVVLFFVNLKCIS